MIPTPRALIVQWEKEAARVDSFHATMGSGWHACADELAASIAAQDAALLALEEEMRSEQKRLLTTPVPDIFKDWQQARVAQLANWRDRLAALRHYDEKTHTRVDGST